MLLILLRILFPLDPVARTRELMRNWLGMVMSWIADPEELEAYAYWSEDRAKLESCICFLEYAMQVLLHDRACQMLGQRYVHVPLQDKPHIRHPKSLHQLLKRLAQLARDFHNLDALAARRANHMRRERDSDPLRLAATPQSTSPSLRLVEANSPLQLNARFASTCAKHWGRWIARSCAQDGGGGAFARGPPSTNSIAYCRPPIASRASARDRPHTPATSRNLRHISPAPLRAPKNRPKPRCMTTRAKTLRLKQAIKRLALARRD
jgi:hypothetical protein